MSAELRAWSPAYAPPAAVQCRCLPPLSRLQLQSMCPGALQQFEAMGWSAGQPVGAARQGAVLWPLDHKGLQKGVGLGYVGKWAKGHAQACVAVGGGGLAVIPEGVESSDQFAWAPSCTGAYMERVQGARLGRLYRGQPLGGLSPVQLDVGTDRGRVAGVGVKAAAWQLPSVQGPAAGTGRLAEGEIGVGCVTEHERLVHHTVLAAEADVVENLGGAGGGYPGRSQHAAVHS